MFNLWKVINKVLTSLITEGSAFIPRLEFCFFSCAFKSGALVAGIPPAADEVGGH